MSAIGNIVTVVTGGGGANSNANSNASDENNAAEQADTAGSTGATESGQGSQSASGADSGEQAAQETSQDSGGAAASETSGGASAESAFAANQADGEGETAAAGSSEGGAEVSAAAATSSDDGGDPVAEFEAFVAKAAESAKQEQTADNRLDSLKKALETLTEITAGGADERIDALFKKVEPARDEKEAQGRDDRFASFGVDHQAARSNAVTGYAAAVSVVRANTDPSAYAAKSKLGVSETADTRA